MSDGRDVQQAFVKGALVFATGFLFERVVRNCNWGTVRRALDFLEEGMHTFRVQRPQLLEEVAPPQAVLSMAEVDNLANHVPPAAPRGTGVFTRTFEEMEALDMMRDRQREHGSVLENKTWHDL